MDKKEIVLSTDGNAVLEVSMTPEQDTVWLNRNQMAELFERDVKTIGKHHYNLDVIISVGYRVKSKRGIFTQQ